MIAFFRDASPHCNYSNVEFFALWLYFVGPSHMGVDHNPLSYYQSCGKYRISEYMFNEGGRCSFKDLIKVIGSAYECELSSIRYENRRSLEVQGQFGVYGITAGIFLCATPVITFAIVMGSLNLIVLRQIRKAAENGGRSLVFHQLNVGCDVAAAFLSISPQFFVIGNLATTIYRAFTGHDSELFLGRVGVLSCSKFITLW